MPTARREKHDGRVELPSPREMKGIDLREPMSSPRGPTDGAAVVAEQRKRASFTFSRLH